MSLSKNFSKREILRQESDVVPDNITTNTVA